MPPRRRLFAIGTPFVHTPQLETHVPKSDKTYIVTSFTAGSSHIVTAFRRMETMLRAHRVPYDILDVGTNPYAQKLVRIWVFKRRKAAEEAKKAEQDAAGSQSAEPKQFEVAAPHLGTNYLPLLYVQDRMVGTYQDVLTLNEKGLLETVLWPNGAPDVNNSTSSSGPAPTTAESAAKTGGATSSPPSGPLLDIPTNQQPGSTSANGPRHAAESAAVAAGVAAAAVAATRAKEARETGLNNIQKQKDGQEIGDNKDAAASAAAAAAVMEPTSEPTSSEGTGADTSTKVNTEPPNSPPALKETTTQSTPETTPSVPDAPVALLPKQGPVSEKSTSTTAASSPSPPPSPSILPSISSSTVPALDASAHSEHTPRLADQIPQAGSTSAHTNAKVLEKKTVGESNIERPIRTVTTATDPGAGPENDQNKHAGDVGDGASKKGQPKASAVESSLEDEPGLPNDFSALKIQ